jgi:hypothetical protein
MQSVLLRRYGSPFHSRPGSATFPIANHAGTDTERLVKNAALRLIEETTRFRAAVRESITQAVRGELIDDDEVRRWLEQQERS